LFHAQAPVRLAVVAPPVLSPAVSLLLVAALLVPGWDPRWPALGGWAAD
jgi:hypothetical protein